MAIRVGGKLAGIAVLMIWYKDRTLNAVPILKSTLSRMALYLRDAGIQINRRVGKVISLELCQNTVKRPLRLI